MSDPVTVTRAQHGWRFYGWWGVVLATLFFIFVTNGLTIGGIQAFDPHLLDTLVLQGGQCRLDPRFRPQPGTRSGCHAVVVDYGAVCARPYSSVWK